MKLFEILDKSYAENIVWRTSSAKRLNGFFNIDELKFHITVEFETVDDVVEYYQIANPEFAALLKDKAIVRVDYTQVLDGEFRQDNTGNAAEVAIPVMSTIVVEIAKKLQREKIDLLYFAAKEFADSKGQRQRIYPKIGKMMAIRLNKRCVVHKQEGQVITMLLSGFDQDDYLKFLELLNDN